MKNSNNEKILSQNGAKVKRNDEKNLIPFQLLITSSDGQTTETTVRAMNASDAHRKARTLDGVTEGTTIKAYPSTTDSSGEIDALGVYRGALLIAKKSAEKAVQRTGGTETQQRILNELKVINHSAGMPGAAEMGTGYIMDLISRVSADAQDFISVAYNGMIEAIRSGESIAEQYHAGYIALNKHIRKQRAATTKELSTEYIRDEDGDLVAIGTYLARLIKSGERYTPTNSASMDADTADRLGAALKSAAETLTPRQKSITVLAGLDLSQRQIADKLNIKSVATVNEHLTRIRETFLEYFTQNAPEFLQLINSAKVTAAAAGRRDANKEKQRRHRERQRQER